MSVREKALKNYTEKKYNCCQAVICAYCEEVGIDDKEIFKLAESFGGGMGGMQDTCGAVTGAFMAIGIHREATRTKAETYSMVSELAKEFKTINGSIYCRDLKAIVDGQQRVSCARCVEVGAELVDKHMGK